MKIIGRKTHGYLDYAESLLLIASPWLFGFYQGGLESWIIILIGAFTVLLSLFTNYELGIAKVVSMPMHLFIDIMSGLLLAVSPWLFDFADQVFLPHLILGIVIFSIAFVTRSDSFLPEGNYNTQV